MTVASRNVSEIPRWFNIHSYATVGRLSPKEWLEHFSVRSYFAGVFALYGKPGDPFRWKEDDAPKLKRGLTKLRAAPLELNEYLLRFTTFDLPHDVREIRRRYDGVRSLSIEEFYEQEKGIPQAAAVEVRAYVHQTFEDLMEHVVLKEEWMSMPVAAFSDKKDAVGLIRVDLSLSDGTLRDQFADWLSETRLLPLKSAKRPKHKKPDRNKWIEMGLLPCLDLLLWSREKDLEPSPIAISRAIYGDPSRVEAVRKTVLPLAIAILDRDDHGLSIMEMLKSEMAVALAVVDRLRSKRFRQGNKPR